MSSLWPALTSEYLAKLTNIKINIADRINTGYNGQRKSNARGNSLEFSDFRDYTPGDDGGRIDWNSFGRLGRLYTKLFEEEKQAVVNFFIDTSASMASITSITARSDTAMPDNSDKSSDISMSKFYFAKLFTASAAYISLRNSDKINIMTMDKSDQKSFTGSSFTELVSFLDNLKADSKKIFDPDIRINPGISIVISDFMLEGGYQNQVKLLQSKKQNVILLHVLSKGELELDMPTGSLRLKDSETGAFRDLELSPSLIDAYNLALSEFLTELREFCTCRGLRYVLAPSDSNMLKLVASLALL